MGFLFGCLTFLAGVTIGTVEVALVNVVVFLALSLLVVRFLEPRFGSAGLVFGMAGAFFLSFMWAAIAVALRGPEECLGAGCPLPEPPVMITLEPAL
ncbi:MAG: hypothetical protein ACK4IS_10395 [Erythrobacter sp.]